MMHATEITIENLASPWRRLAAKTLDLLLAVVIGLLIPKGIGAILGFLYSITADSIHFKKFDSQSIGKKILGIKIKHLHGVARISLKRSIIRNAPVGIAMFFAIFPFWGWILAILVGGPLFLIEIILIIRAQNRQRLGDVMSDTVVVRVVQVDRVVQTT
jgi:uncharacterized RDD family membrane protein YckC